MAPCRPNSKEFKISFTQVKLVPKIEVNFGWHTWKLHYQNCSIQKGVICVSPDGALCQNQADNPDMIFSKNNWRCINDILYD